jgi:anti-sigma factor RsiW
VNGEPKPVREEDLHAYVDGQLDPSRRRAVESHLAISPESTRRVADYFAQREALRTAFAPRASEPLPPNLNLSRLLEARFSRPRPAWELIAAGIALLIVGGIGGWLVQMHEAAGRDQAPIAVLSRQALATHTVYGADRTHPIEVLGTERDHLTQWLSNRLNRKVTPPDLSAIGYRLIGGRLLATERGGAAALFMYENDAHVRLSVVVRPMAPDLHAPQTEMASGGFNLCAWIENGLGYAVVAAEPDAEIDRVFDYLHKEIAGRT